MQGTLSVSSLGLVLPDGSTLFRNLDASFGRERTGLIGPNGVGKSTLLAVLAGHREPSEGGVHREARTALLTQLSRFGGDATVADELGVSGLLRALARAEQGNATLEELSLIDGAWDLPERVATALERCGIAHIDTDTPLGRLSGGERVRVRFAGLLLADADFVLLDEPTNHLDVRGRAFVYEFVAGWKGGLLTASHDRRLLGLVDRIAELRPDGLALYGGNWHFYRARKAEEQEAARQHLRAAEEELDAVRRASRAAAERQERRSSRGRSRFLERQDMPRVLAGARKRRAQETAGKLSDVHGRRIGDAQQRLREAKEAVDELPVAAVDLQATKAAAARRMLALEEVNVRFPGQAHPFWSQGVNLVVTGRERIALVGANGTGKTLLLQIAAGLRVPELGAMHIGARRAVYLDQHAAFLQPELSVLDNLRAGAPGKAEHEARILLARLGFPGNAALKPAAVLSGGERMRAAVACLLAADQAPDFLLLDEPDNNLDLSAMQAMADALRRYSGAMLVVSHDEAFLDDVGITRRFELPACTDGRG